MALSIILMKFGNFYTYCGNNPVNCNDPSGDWPIGLVGAGVGAGAGAIGSIAVQYFQFGGVQSWPNVGWNALTGAAAGFAMTTQLGISLNGTMGIGGVSNLANYLLSNSTAVRLRKL